MSEASVQPLKRSVTSIDGAHAERDADRIRVALLTGGEDRHYAYGLTFGLVGRGVAIDFIGSDELEGPEIRGNPAITFLNLRGSHNRQASRAAKVRRVARYYGRLIAYAAGTPTPVFHILWNNKVETFDRTLLMLYYRALGKRVVLTAHNVNPSRRGAKDTLLSRLTLRVQYKLCDQVFVHTARMKQQLVDAFSMSNDKVTVIPYGINNAVPSTSVTSLEAKQHFGIDPTDRTILAFGNIGPYKGLEHLAAAFNALVARDARYRLLVAGTPKPGAHEYWQSIAQALEPHVRSGRALPHIRHVPDGEAELYFKAADVLVLPYRDIFQSGVLFFGFSFGLPAVATDVGSLRDDIVEGRTGFMCRPDDPESLAAAIETYFASDLFMDLDRRRSEIKAFAESRHSWETVAELTRNVYKSVAPRRPHV